MADKASIRSAGSARYRPVPPPKDKRQPRPSTLHMSSSQPELVQRKAISKRRPGRRHQYPIISQLASLKHWFVESAKRARSPNPKAASGSGMHRKFLPERFSPGKGPETTKEATADAIRATAHHSDELATPTQVKRASYASSLAPSSASYPNHRHSYPRQHRLSNPNASSHRSSMSPSPLTPRNSYRRSSAGLRGRKSTSSSVSSIRSIYHTHTHSKASSVSSNSGDTTSTPTVRAARSPHASVKVLPTTPGASARFPSNIRYVRGPGGGLREIHGDTDRAMPSAFNEGIPAPLATSPSSGLVFARRKRSAFKGPMAHTANLMLSGGIGSPSLNGKLDTEDISATSGRPAARRSQIIVEEEDIEDEDIEEVDAFSGPEDHTTVLEDDQDSQGDQVKAGYNSNADGSGLTLSPDSGQRPALAPSPELGPSPIRPPRSSSLRMSSQAHSSGTKPETAESPS